jgi:endo-1,4-beta-D-glucanase Y
MNLLDRTPLLGTLNLRSAAWCSYALTVWATTLACSHTGTGSNGTGGTTAMGGSSSGGAPPATGGLPAAGGTTGGNTQLTGGQSGAAGATSGGSAGVSSLGGGGQAGSGGASGGASAGTAGGGASSGTCKMGAPTPASGGANFPFPQHRFSTYCSYPPNCNDADVSVGWTNYKALLVVDGGDGSLRVRRPENMDDSVSEGIAYGMLFAVFLNDKTTFDKLWQYAQKHFDDNGLMHWQIRADGTVQGGNSATDSDEDIGFALVMADKQWGGYTDVTKAYLAKVLDHDFHDDGTIRGGDNYDEVNPSYLAPAFYRTFAKYTGEQRWMQVIDKSYEILNGAAHPTTGLVPDWSSGDRGRNYTYDAVRTPYRIALDACWNNEPRAKAYAEKVGAFFAGVGVDNIRDGYALDGTLTGEYKNSTFIGPAGVAGMVGNQSTLISQAYAQVAMDLQAGTESYYNLSWALFTAMMMTGNFADLTAP